MVSSIKLGLAVSGYILMRKQDIFNVNSRLPAMRHFLYKWVIQCITGKQGSVPLLDKMLK